jgi:hypothetical protein
MSTGYDDINEIVQRAFPQGAAIIRHEGGGGLMYRGARDLIHNAQLAVEILGPRGAKALANALLAVGQRHVAVAERMRELAAAGEASTPATAHSGASYNTKAET